MQNNFIPNLSIMLFQSLTPPIIPETTNHFPHSNLSNIYSPREENALSLRREYFTLARGIVSPREENIYQTK